MTFKVIKLRRSSERFISSREWLKSKHSFSFAEHSDPSWDNFGKIRVINEDIISPNSGFESHSHSNMEIITVVTKGSITHIDSLNNLVKIHENEVQVMSAGTGITHSEKNEENKICKLFQIWIFPNQKNLKPDYKQGSINKTFGEDLIISSDGKRNKLFINQDIFIWRCKYKPLKDKHLPSEIKKFNWIQIIDGNLLVRCKYISSDVCLSSGDGLGFETSHAKDFSIETEGEVDFLLFSMPTL